MLLLAGVSLLFLFLLAETGYSEDLFCVAELVLDSDFTGPSFFTGDALITQYEVCGSDYKWGEGTRSDLKVCCMRNGVPNRCRARPIEETGCK